MQSDIKQSLQENKTNVKRIIIFSVGTTCVVTMFFYSYCLHQKFNAYHSCSQLIQRKNMRFDTAFSFS